MKNKNEKLSQNKANGGLADETVEAVLLSGGDKMLEEKLINELKQEKDKIEAQKHKRKTVITDFSALPENCVFSEKAFYRLFNRETEREFFINGIDLECRIGLNQAIFDKLKSRKMKAICIDNNIITFDRAEV